MTSFTRVALSALTITLFAAGGTWAQGAPAAAAPAAAPANTRIGYVNSQRIMPQAPGFVDAQQTAETETEGVKAQVQKMSDSLDRMVQDYRKAQATLTPAQRAQREQAISGKQQEYQQRAAALEARAQQHQAELFQPIREQIGGIIEALRTEGGYAVILDVGNQFNVVVAVDTTLDLTDRVLAKLADAGPPKKGPAKPAKPAPAAATKPTGISRPGQPPRGR